FHVTGVQTCALPISSWPSTWVYAGIVGVLALIGWAGLARVVRGQVLAVREVDFVSAARALGARDVAIVVRHVVPNLTSYLIVARAEERRVGRGRQPR